MTATSIERWIRVKPGNPCQICKHDGFCEVSPDGAIAGCMRVSDGAFKTVPSALGDKYLHRLTDEPREIPVARPKPSAASVRDVMADRAVFAIMVRACAALPEVATNDLVRRFGPLYGPRIAERFGIGYCDGPALVQALDAAGRRQDAIAAKVLRCDGSVPRSLLGHLLIPHFRDGLVHDIRIAGIKGIHEKTKEISLPGSYADRDIADLFHNHDALKDVGKNGTIHVCGGAYKTMALALAGLLVVGLRGEAELSAGHIAALQAAGVRTIILHIDAEDPKEGQPLSAGRRLGLTKAERLTAANFVVRVAEPPREPGTAKVDPDALLRDLGPRAVRDYALSAIPLDAWRVVIGVTPTSISDEAAAEIETLRQRCAKQQRTLSNVLHIRKNGAIKAERDALTASVLRMVAAQESGQHTPSGRIRQPLWIIADDVGKEKPTVSKHLKIGPGEGLFERELLEEVLVREVDEETGQTRNILRLKDAEGRVVEECPAEQVLGAALAYRQPTGEDATGSYYVTPLHEPTKILDILVTLDPVKLTKDGEVKDKWGGKREPCPHCQSLRRLKIDACADCGHEFSRKVEEPPADTPLPQRDEPDIDVPSVPPTSIEDLAAMPPTYPHESLANVREDEDEDLDTWDPNFCNHPGCVQRLNPALGKRFCWQHRETGIEPEAPSVRPPANPSPPFRSEIIDTPDGPRERIWL